MAVHLPAVVAVILAALAVPGAVLAAGKCKLEGLAQIPVTMQGSKPQVAARINGKDVKFVVDSGAFFSILSPASAEALNLPRELAPGEFRVRGGGGSTQPTIARVQDFGLAGAVVNNLEFLVAGGSTGEEVGLLGQNVLSFADIEYDLGGGAIRMMRAESCKDSDRVYWVKPGEPFSSISIRPVAKFESHIIGTAYLNGKKIRVMFDTGSPMSILNLHAAERAGVKTTSPGVESSFTLRGGAGLLAVPSWVAPFSSFKIGDEEIRNTRLRIADIDFPDADMLLGVDFFLSHRIHVAWGRNKLLFTRRAGAVFDAGHGSAEMVVAPGEALADAEDARDAPSLGRRSALYAARGDLPRALADIALAITLAPQEPEYYLQRGRLYQQARQGQLALADFDQAIQLRSNYLDARVARAGLLLTHLHSSGSGSAQDIIAEIDAARALAPRDADIHFELGAMYAGINAQERAVAEFDQWLALHRDDGRSADALAYACRARGLLGQELAKALADCNRAVQDRPGVPFPLESRGLIHVRLRNFERAINDLDKVVAQQPGNAWALYTRGLAKVGAGRARDGEEDMATAKALDRSVVSDAATRGLVP